MDLGVKGYIPSGMIDWEGKIAATMFISGCNYKCPFCHNPGLATKEKNEPDIPWSHIEGHLKSKGGWLDGVVISGGEPTTYEGLLQLIAKIKGLGFSVKLDTNGSNAKMIKELITAELVDFISMDIKTSWAKYPQATGRDDIEIDQLCTAIRLIMESGLPHEFRTTVVPGIVDFDDVRSIAHIIQGADKYCLQQFNPKVTLSSKYSILKPFGHQDISRMASVCSEYLETSIRGLN